MNVEGGTLSLVNSGVLTAATTINVNGATLELDDSGLPRFASNRISPAASVTLNSGTLLLNSGNNVPALEQINNLVAAQGANGLSVATSGTLNIGNLVRTANQGTVNFTGLTLGYGGPGSGADFYR